jgi:hypothetical protein
MELFYSSIDLLVLSSKTEGFPNVLVEAVGYSIPSFSTDVGDAKTIINNDAHISPAGNPELLAKNILQFIGKSEEERYMAIKETHDHVVRRFSMDKFVKAYCRF